MIEPTKIMLVLDFILRAYKVCVPARIAVPLLLAMMSLVSSKTVLATEPTNVIFIHGANVSEQDACVWASEMFKRLWHSGAQMEFHPIAWESDISPTYNYQVNASNAFVTASRVAPLVNQISGRKVVIAHSLGTMVAAAATQDYRMQVDKLIMLNSAIHSEAFENARRFGIELTPTTKNPTQLLITQAQKKMV